MTQGSKCNSTLPLEDVSGHREENKNEGRISMNSVEQSRKHSSVSDPNSIQFMTKGSRESAYRTKRNAITAKAMHPQESSVILIKSALNKHSGMLSDGTKNRVNELLPDSTKIVHDLCHEGALTCDKNGISGNGGGRNRRRNYGPSNDFVKPPMAEDASIKEYSDQETDLNFKKGSKHEIKRLRTFDFVGTNGDNIITNDDSGRDNELIALKSIETGYHEKAGDTYQSINKDDDDEEWDEEESSLESDEEEGSSLVV